MQKYWIRVTCNDQAKIISLYSPDLDIEFLKGKEKLDEDDYSQPYVTKQLRSYIAKELIARLNSLNRSNQKITPKTIMQLQHISLTPLQHWECIEIDHDKQCGFFSRVLPFVGQLSNILSILAAAYITYMSLRIVSSSNDDEHNSPGSIALSVLGAIFGSIIALIMYVCSGASKMLAGIGQHTDKLLFKKCRTNDAVPFLTKTGSKSNNSYRLISRSLTTTGAIGCVVANTIITSIRQYQETILLTDRYLDLYPSLTASQRELDFELLKWLVVNLFVFTMAFSGLAFQGSFAVKLVERVNVKLDKWFESRSNSGGLSIDSDSEKLPGSEVNTLFDDNESSEESEMPGRIGHYNDESSQGPSYRNLLN